MSSPRQSVRIYAPGSVGNVGPGLDILGLAIAGAGDIVRLDRCDGELITIVEPGDPSLPTDPTKHTAAIAAQAVFRRASVRPGVRLFMAKGLPLSGGQGGSAASAVAGAVAANLLVAANLDRVALLECALEAEQRISGYHADNLAPSLLGGLVLVRSLQPIDLISLPVPPALRLVIIKPEQQLRTREARGVLPASVARETALHQAAQVAAMVAGACLNDLPLFGRAIDDRIAEPARTALLPGFVEAKRAALAAGALGCSISGAGPTAFAVVAGEDEGARVLAAMMSAYQALNIQSSGRVTTVDHLGAREMS